MNILEITNPLASTPHIFETENRSLFPERSAGFFEIPAPKMEKHDPLHVFREKASKIGEVERIVFSYQSIPAGQDIIHLFTIIDEDTKEVRKQIYAIEMLLMERFPKGDYNFNFHLIARRGRPLANLLSDKGCSILFEKRAGLSDALPSGTPSASRPK